MFVFRWLAHLVSGRMALFFILTAFVVIKVKRIDKIAEQCQAFLARLFLGLFGWRWLFFRSGFLFVERHPSLIEHMLLNVDRHIRANRQRNCIARPSVDLKRMAALL